MDKINYAAYLQSEEWQRKKKLVIEFWGGRCCICNGKDNLQVHHRTYQHLGNEQLTDLILLCDRCHELHHKHTGRACRTEHIKDVLERVAYQCVNGGRYG